MVTPPRSIKLDTHAARIARSLSVFFYVSGGVVFAVLACSVTSRIEAYGTARITDSIIIHNTYSHGRLN